MDTRAGHPQGCGFVRLMVDLRRQHSARKENVPGRRTDVSDCQRLQFLHSVGLLEGVLPARALLALRQSLSAYRSYLAESSP